MSILYTLIFATLFLWTFADGLSFRFGCFFSPARSRQPTGRYWSATATASPPAMALKVANHFPMHCNAIWTAVATTTR
jgi:hypothetical protein